MAGREGRFRRAGVHVVRNSDCKASQKDCRPLRPPDALANCLAASGV